MEKKRHTVIFDDQTWEIVRFLSFHSKRSISDIVRTAVKKYAEEEYGPLIRLMSVETVSDEEQKEIEEELKKLSKEDLEIVDEEEIDL